MRKVFSSVRKKIEKKFWDMEIIGNRRKNNFFKIKGQENKEDALN